MVNEQVWFVLIYKWLLMVRCVSGIIEEDFF